MLAETARKALLDVARRTVEAAVRGEKLPEFEVHDPELADHQGAFVTLRTGGNLRGCIGRFTADKPLWQVVQDMALASATEDPRFLATQLTPDELAWLNLED